MQEFINGIDRKQFIRYVAIYFLIVGVITLCGGAAAAGLGSFASVIGSVAPSEITSDPQAAAALNAMGAVSGLLTLLGIVNLILGPMMIITAWGLFNRKSWARMGAVVVAFISLVSSLLGLINGGGILNLVWVLVGAFVLYMFYTDERLKAEFPQS